jgi:hypothetical protein
MKSKRHRVILAGLLLGGAVAWASCAEDNPDECYSDEDCPPASNLKATICIKTYYNSGIPSGGYCAECESDQDCTDPAFPTCNTLFHTCVCESDSGICGPGEGGVPDGGAVPDGGGVAGTGPEPDDAGSAGGPAPEPDDAGQ